MKFLLNLNQSLDAIRSNLFRAGITIFIIALGITALVFVRTSIDGMKYGLGASFSSLGANTFRVKNRATSVRFGRRGKQARQRFPDITYRDAMEFKTAFEGIAPVSVTGSGGGANQAKYLDRETNPNISIEGTDENYLQTSRYNVVEGRFISADDVELAKNVVVLGYEVKELLFPFESPVGKFITIKGAKYKVIGVLESMGTTGMSSLDRRVVTPISTLRNKASNLGSLTLNVYVENPEQMEGYMSEATGAFRVIRGLTPRESNNFAVDRSDVWIGQLLENFQVITLAAQIIALITLLGASVALLNVMLVSVTERTTEIGLRKSLGASSSNILSQFLWEAIVICQIGGLLGILLGILGGNIVGNLLFEGTFVIPWSWIIVGLISCFVVGILSGFYPAWKAARVDPIVALRHV
ncbi:MAG: ABC transporter permease [Bacteroidota bacterium]